MGEIKELKRVDVNEIGLLIKVVNLDYSPKDNQELADLISEHFNVECSKEDIDNYEMNFVAEDYEKINREVEYEKVNI